MRSLHSMYVYCSLFYNNKTNVARVIPDESKSLLIAMNNFKKLNDHIQARLSQHNVGNVCKNVM